MKVDYDRRQHEVYAEGRRPSEAVMSLWAEILARHLDGSPLLDLGAGVGTWSVLLAEACGADVTGVEPSARMRAVAEREHPHPRVRFIPGSGEEIPLGDGACGGALMSYVFHHLRDRDACAAELRRVLRPGARVVIRSAFRESLPGVPFFKWFPTAMAIDEARMPARAEVVELFERHAFETVADEVVWQETSPTMRVYYERLKLRAVSTLELLPDDEFAAGVERTRVDAEREPDKPVRAPVDMVVFRA